MVGIVSSSLHRLLFFTLFATLAVPLSVLTPSSLSSPRPPFSFAPLLCFSPRRRRGYHGLALVVRRWVRLRRANTDRSTRSGSVSPTAALGRVLGFSPRLRWGAAAPHGRGGASGRHLAIYVVPVWGYLGWWGRRRVGFLPGGCRPFYPVSGLRPPAVTLGGFLSAGGGGGCGPPPAAVVRVLVVAVGSLALLGSFLG